MEGRKYKRQRIEECKPVTVTDNVSSTEKKGTLGSIKRDLSWVPLWKGRKVRDIRNRVVNDWVQRVEAANQECRGGWPLSTMIEPLSRVIARERLCRRLLSLLRVAVKEYGLSDSAATLFSSWFRRQHTLPPLAGEDVFWRLGIPALILSTPVEETMKATPCSSHECKHASCISQQFKQAHGASSVKVETKEKMDLSLFSPETTATVQFFSVSAAPTCNEYKITLVTGPKHVDLSGIDDLLYHFTQYGSLVMRYFYASKYMIMGMSGDHFDRVARVRRWPPLASSSGLVCLYVALPDDPCLVSRRPSKDKRVYLPHLPDRIDECQTAYGMWISEERLMDLWKRYWQANPWQSFFISLMDTVTCFHEDVWRMLQQYNPVVRDVGAHAAVPDEAHRVFQELFGVSHECYSSPLNCYRYNTFGSVFPHTDTRFGSAGPFLQWKPVGMRGSYLCNPCFQELDVLLGVRHSLLLLQEAAQEEQPLSFIWVFPTHRETTSLSLLQRSPFWRHEHKLERDRHSYCHGVQHMYAAVPNRPSPVDTSIVWIQNSLVPEAWCVTSEKLDRLTFAFR